MCLCDDAAGWADHTARVGAIRAGLLAANVELEGAVHGGRQGGHGGGTDVVLHRLAAAGVGRPAGRCLAKGRQRRIGKGRPCARHPGLHALTWGKQKQTTVAKVRGVCCNNITAIK